MTEKIRAVTVSKPGAISVREYDRPEVRSKDALLKIEMSGVCGTDPHIIFDEKPPPMGYREILPVNTGTRVRGPAGGNGPRLPEV